MSISLILFVINLLLCNSYATFSLDLRNNKPDYKYMNNVKNIHFSVYEKLVIFIYKTGEVDIVTNNISIYYKKLYNNSLNSTNMNIK